VKTTASKDRRGRTEQLESLGIEGRGVDDAVAAEEDVPARSVLGAARAFDERSPVPSFQVEDRHVVTSASGRICRTLLSHLEQNPAASRENLRPSVVVVARLGRRDRLHFTPLCGNVRKARTSRGEEDGSVLEVSSSTTMTHTAVGEIMTPLEFDSCAKPTTCCWPNATTGKKL
jgi:hypothetical protein